MGNCEVVMGDNGNLKPFAKGKDPRRSLSGRPKKLKTVLKGQGYTGDEIKEAILALIKMTPSELVNKSFDPECTMLERIVIKNLSGSVKSGKVSDLISLITRAVGNPVQPVEGNFTGIEVTIKGK